MTARCHRCGAERPAAARFCSACGAPTRQHQKAVLAAGRDAQRRSSRAAIAFGIACTATLFGLVTGSRWVDGDAEWGHVLVGGVVIGGAGVLATAVLGEWRVTVPWRCRWPWLPLAVAAGLLTLGVSMGYVAMLASGRADGDASAEATLATWVAVVVLAPLGEEWLCRGVAWRASATMANQRTALLLTSILFAFLHGLSGHLAAVPHRFVSGLGYGWLRWRSGSLLPGMIAHAVHNAVAVGWLE